MIFFLNSLHQLCHVCQDSLLQIFHEGKTDLPDIPLPSFKNVAAAQLQKKTCTAFIFYTVLLIQELSCILLKTNTISLTHCSVAKPQLGTPHSISSKLLSYNVLSVFESNQFYAGKNLKKIHSGHTQQI